MSFPQNSDVARRAASFDAIQALASDRLRSDYVMDQLGPRAVELAELVEAAIPVGRRGSEIIVPEQHDPARPLVYIHGQDEVGMPTVVQNHEIQVVNSHDTVANTYNVSGNVGISNGGRCTYWPVGFDMIPYLIDVCQYTDDHEVVANVFIHESDHWRFQTLEHAEGSSSAARTNLDVRAESSAYGVNRATLRDPAETRSLQQSMADRMSSMQGSSIRDMVDEVVLTAKERYPGGLNYNHNGMVTVAASAGVFDDVLGGHDGLIAPSQVEAYKELRLVGD